jgi:hypothetical protein
MNIKAKTLSEAFRLIQTKNHQSTRGIAKLMDMNASTVWRTINYPTRSSSINFVKLVVWSRLDWATVNELFANEMDSLNQS